MAPGIMPATTRRSAFRGRGKAGPCHKSETLLLCRENQRGDRMLTYQEYLDSIDPAAYHQGEWQWEEDGYTCLLYTSGP